MFKFSLGSLKSNCSVSIRIPRKARHVSGALSCSLLPGPRTLTRVSLSSVLGVPMNRKNSKEGQACCLVHYCRDPGP